MNNLAASAELELLLKGISALTEMLFYYSNDEGLRLRRKIGAEGVLPHPPEHLLQALIIFLYDKDFSFEGEHGLRVRGSKTCQGEGA